MPIRPGSVAAFAVVTARGDDRGERHGEPADAQRITTAEADRRASRDGRHESSSVIRSRLPRWRLPQRKLQRARLGGVEDDRIGRQSGDVGKDDRCPGLDDEDRGDQVDRLDALELAIASVCVATKVCSSSLAAVAHATASLVANADSNRSNTTELRELPRARRNRRSPAHTPRGCGRARSPAHRHRRRARRRRWPRTAPGRPVRAASSTVSRVRSASVGANGAAAAGRAIASAPTAAAIPAAPTVLIMLRRVVAGSAVTRSTGVCPFGVHAHDSLAPGGASAQL